MSRIRLAAVGGHGSRAAHAGRRTGVASAQDGSRAHAGRVRRHRHRRTSRARTRSSGSSTRAASSIPSARSRARSGSKRVTKENVRDAGDRRQRERRRGAAPASVPPLPLPPLPAGNACSILSLDLGPINLNVLGLVVRTNQIQLRIDAVQGPGNLLGNLLCGITGILEPTGAPGEHAARPARADPERAARALSANRIAAGRTPRRRVCEAAWPPVAAGSSLLDAAVHARRRRPDAGVRFARGHGRSSTRGDARARRASTPRARRRR